jgi:hypothetical protein
MSREGHIDYYSATQDGTSFGCCLLCSDAKPGCLCYSCKCTKCYWYEPERVAYGLKPCEMVDILKEESKQKWIKEQKEIQIRKNKEYDKKIKSYKVRENSSKNIFKKENKPTNTYTCQKCGVDFITSVDLIIIPNEVPLCYICLNKNAEENEKWKKRRL